MVGICRPTWSQLGSAPMHRHVRKEDLSMEDRPIANPMVVLREEFDDWAILFDPDTAQAYGLNPMGVFVWKRLDGNHTITEILNELRAVCKDAPAEANDHMGNFVKKLVEKGLAGYEITKVDHLHIPHGEPG
jgi:SynChlorMet cassette protein ScmD